MEIVLYFGLFSNFINFVFSGFIIKKIYNYVLKYNSEIVHFKDVKTFINNDFCAKASLFILIFSIILFNTSLALFVTVFFINRLIEYNIQNKTLT